MKLRRATENDSDALKEFFERMVLPGGIDLSIRRYGSFFDQYRLMSDDYEVLILTEGDTIEGMATLVFRDGFVMGEKRTWGYATDLRIAPTRKAVVQWAQHFLPVLDYAHNEKRCERVFSAVELQGNQAYNALIRPSSHGRRRFPRYYLANRFYIVNAHARFPFSEKPLESIRLKTLDLEGVEPLCAYLRERATSRPLASLHTPESFLARLKNWPGLSLSDFRIASDARGKILGCAALWDPKVIQSLIPSTYHGFSQTVHQLLGAASYLQLARPMARPGQEMQLKLLTHLQADSGEVFHRLFAEAYSRLARKEFMSYLHFRGNFRTLPPKSYVVTAIPFGLYMILPPNAEPPVWPSPNMRELPPEFDVAWI